VRGVASHPSIAASENHTVRLPRWRRLASYSRQFITLRFCLGIWRRRSSFSLNGKVGIQGSEEGQSSYVGPDESATGRIHATRPRRLAQHTADDTLAFPRPSLGPICRTPILPWALVRHNAAWTARLPLVSK
jgi:hypothetical protein